MVLGYDIIKINRNKLEAKNNMSLNWIKKKKKSFFSHC